MIRHIVECEQCKAFYPFEPMDRLSQYNHAPEDWLVLFHAKDLQGQEGWHFCSKECLKRWLRSVAGEQA